MANQKKLTKSEISEAFRIMRNAKRRKDKTILSPTIADGASCFLRHLRAKDYSQARVALIRMRNG